MAPTLASSPNGSSVIDLTLSHENTIEFPPSSTFIEILNTDVCGKVRFPEEVRAEILDAHLRHHSSGQGGEGFPLLYVHGVWTNFVRCILTLRVWILFLFDNSALFIYVY